MVWWNCVQILVNAELKIGKRGQKTGLTGGSPLGWRRSALDCSAVQEEEEEEEEEEDSGTVTGFSPGTSVFPCHYHSANAQ